MIATDENDDSRTIEINYGWIVKREMTMARVTIRSRDPLRLRVVKGLHRKSEIEIEIVDEKRRKNKKR